MSDEIYGIGVGTGDPEELTLKAVRLIKESDVLILPRKDKAKCRAYQIKTQAVSGVSSLTACANRLGIPLCEGGELLHVIPDLSSPENIHE